MLMGKARQMVIQMISLARVKLLYERITLTRFTVLYFFCAVATCILLSSLQIVSLAHNLGAISLLSSVIEKSNVTGIAVLKKNKIELCSGFPTDPTTTCTWVVTLDGELQTDIFPRKNAKIKKKKNNNAIDVDDNEGDDDNDGGGDNNGDDDNVSFTVSAQFPATAVTSSPFTSALPESSPIPPTSIPVLPTSISVLPTSISVPPASIPVLSTSIPVPPASTVAKTVTTNPPSPPPPVTTSTSMQTSVPSASVPYVTSSPNQNSSGPEKTCVVLLMWLNDVLHDAIREDVVTLLFQIWLLILALVTILNQSIPHLGAGLLGHMLGTAWGSYRVHFIKNLRDKYQRDILPRTCNNQDFLGGWFEDQIRDAIPLVVLNSLAFLLLGYCSYKLLKDYANQTSQRVGASPKVHRIYKFVLGFSLFLQVSAFFSLASVAMWIDKVSHGSTVHLAKHAKLYLAASIVTLVVLFPWLIIGWIGVRRERHIKFAFFFFISLLLIGISTSMFSSNLYRYIFSSWPFFATTTIAAFIFFIGTAALGTICRLNFGQGLAHYLEVNDALEQVDFTPVYFDNQPRGGDPEKLLHRYTEATQNLDYRLPVPIHSGQHTPPIGGVRDDSGNSIYSDNDRLPIQLSSSVPLESEMVPVKRISLFSQMSRVSHAFKKFSVYASSVSVKGVRREWDTEPINGSAHVPIPPLLHLSGLKDLGPFADPSPTLPSPCTLSLSNNVSTSAADSQSSTPFAQD